LWYIYKNDTVAILGEKKLNVHQTNYNGNNSTLRKYMTVHNSYACI